MSYKTFKIIKGNIQNEPKHMNVKKISSTIITFFFGLIITYF
nr:MAG TPA: hypothetical protein [Caudoviricetes sp.]